MTQLHMKLLKNALVMPLVGSMDSFSGGVFDEKGIFLEDSIPGRGGRPLAARPARILKGAYVYGGCLFGHFGHFIWETLARMAAIRACPKLPVLFISPNARVYETQKLFFKTVGIRNSIELALEPSQVEGLVYSVPQSSVAPPFISPEQIKTLAYLNVPQPSSPEKIWLSRRLLKCGRVLNENEIESELAKFGYKIVNPEKLSLLEQIKLTSSAKIVAGFDGSQFFSVIFSKKAWGNFFVFNRRVLLAPTLAAMFTQKGIPYSLHNFNVRLVNGTVDMAGADYVSLEPERIVETLKSA